MISDMLSQDEIDALLKQNNMDDNTNEDGAELAGSATIDDYLSAIEQDALGEIGNISFGSASTALSTLLNQKVDITTPSISLIERIKLKEEFPKPHVAIHVNYTEGFEGVNLLVIKQEDAKIIANLMLGGDGTNPDPVLNELHLSAVQEAMNQMMGSASTSMSTIFGKRVDISPPGIDIVDFTDTDNESSFIEEDIYIKVSFRMKIGELIDSNIMQLLPIPFAKSMVHSLLHPESTQPESTQQENKGDAELNMAREEIKHGELAAAMATYEQEVSQQPNYQQTYQGPAYQQQHIQQPVGQQTTGYQTSSQMVDARSTNVQPVQFASFDTTSNQGVDTKNLDLLLDIPLQVTVELGRTKKMIKEILELSPGSILELDKLAGEPVDILVNNKLIAKGEVVVIEENFGVRVTDILSQWERLQKIQ